MTELPRHPPTHTHTKPSKPQNLLTEANGNNLKYKRTEKQEAESELGRILDFGIYKMIPIITLVIRSGYRSFLYFNKNRKKKKKHEQKVDWGNSTLRYLQNDSRHDIG